MGQSGQGWRGGCSLIRGEIWVEGDTAGHLPLTVRTQPAYSQPACPLTTSLPPQAWLPLAQGNTRQDGKGLISHSQGGSCLRVLEEACLTSTSAA